MTRQQLTATLVTTIGLLLVALAAGGRAVALGQPLPAGRLPPPADLGSGFTYQGFLEDNGNPINGSCDFLFELRDSETGGSQVGLTDTEMNVTVQEGAFTVQLNDTGQFGPDAFAGQPRWLEVAMRCPAGTGNYTILSPRQPLTAVPYALGLQPGATISGTINSGTLNLANGSGPGLVVNSAAGDGILVYSAGNPSFHVSSLDSSGLEVYGAEGDGLFVGRADGSGIYVNSAGSSGVRVGLAGYAGLYVGHANNSGVHVSQADVDGVFVGSAGLHGVNVDAASADGLHVSNVGSDGITVGAAGDFAGYFNGNVQITGSCTGCAQAVFGVNSSSTSLQPGAIVALQAARAPSEALAGTPILMQVAPARAGQVIVGVVVGRAELDSDEEDAKPPRLVPREGAAAPGEYVTIMISGLAQIRANALNYAIVPGDRLTIHESGAARPLRTALLNGMMVTEGAPTVGIALQGLTAGEEGLLWVLVNPN